MNPNPFLQYKYATGLGDLVACSLHSKLLNPITKLVTGRDEMCHACDSRRKALNILFPIPIWKMFFKTLDDRDNAFNSHFDTKDEEQKIEPENPIKNNNQPEEENAPIVENNSSNTKVFISPEIEEIVDYKFINSSDVELDNYMIRTTIYKKIWNS